MISVILLLVLCAFVLTLGSAMGKVPLWIPVLLVTIILLLQAVPLR